ncbi:MAG: LysR family transcriptional regulator [Oceanospirillaceae bacterium]
MNLSYLQSYAAVVSQGGFSAAAEHLQVSKGLVSRHVNNLETQLNVKLLHRTTRVIRMSQAGEKLYVEAQKIFSQANSVERDIQDMTQEASGLLRFTAPISIGDRIMQDLLVPYQKECPNVALELNFSNRAFDLASGENDIGLRAFASLPELVVAKSVGKMRNVLVASVDYLNTHPTVNSLQDLKAHNCILNSHQQAWNVWQMHRQKITKVETQLASTSPRLPTYDESLQAQPVVVSGNIATSKYATAKMLAEQGCGIASLPWYCVEPSVADNKLQRVLVDYELYVHEMAIIHAAERLLPKKLKVFKRLLVEWFVRHPQYCADKKL